MKTSILITVLALVATSCKKEIKIKVNQAETKLVIEADILAGQKDNVVHITKTGHINEANEFQSVSGAVVMISDGEGYVETLSEDQPGFYHTHAFNGVTGRTYVLTVRCEGKTYEARSTLQEPVHLDTVVIVRSSYGGMPMDGFLPVYRDKPGVKNYYRFIQYLNGRRLAGSILRDDTFTDGQLSNQPLLNMDLVLKNGDVYGVEMQCVDEVNYQYFRTKQQTTNVESAAPANPLSNISDGALGYFNVCNSQKTSMTVHE